MPYSTYWLLQFNGGPRICIGQQFALTEASYVTIRLLQRLEKVESMETDPVVRHNLTLTNCSGNGVKVRLQAAWPMQDIGYWGSLVCVRQGRRWLHIVPDSLICFKPKRITSMAWNYPIPVERIHFLWPWPRCSTRVALWLGKSPLKEVYLRRTL